MSRKPRTDAERTLHRVNIAMLDLTDAERFIKAAQEANGADPTIHQALVCAAVIYYARPFVPNELRNPKKRPPDAADTVVDLGPLKRWISDPARRLLHRRIVRLRNKIVAHAESRYFDVRMYRSEEFPPEVRTGDFGVLSSRPQPALDLEAMRRNTVDLRSALVWQHHALAPDVPRGKRLRRLPA